MAYQVRFINPLHQHGKIEFELVVDDGSADFPLRLWRKYREDISQAELEADAKQVVLDWLNNPPALPIDPEEARQEQLAEQISLLAVNDPSMASEASALAGKLRALKPKKTKPVKPQIADIPIALRIDTPRTWKPKGDI